MFYPDLRLLAAKQPVARCNDPAYGQGKQTFLAPLPLVLLPLVYLLFCIHHIH
jgi:hypothetical protein